MLTEIKEEKYINILKRLNIFFKLDITIDNLDNKDAVIKLVKHHDADVYNKLTEYNITFESYRFIRSDRDLMMKARAIWEMERKNIVETLEKVNNEFEELLLKKKI